MDSKKPTICVLGASHSTWNRGVSALATGTVECILERFPDARLVFLDYGREDQTYTCHVGTGLVTIDIVNMRFSKWIMGENHIARLLFMALILRILKWEWLRQRIIPQSKPLRSIAGSDLVVAISGGDSFSDIYGLMNLLYVALPQVLVLLSGKSLVLLPQTIGPFDSLGAKLIARYIMLRAKRVYSRDWAGERTAREILGRRYVDGKVVFSYDVAFALKPLAPKSVTVCGIPYSSQEKRIGINISGLLLSSRDLGNGTFGLKVDYESLIFRLLNLIMDITGDRVVLIPHVFGGASHSQSDLVACEYVYNKVKDKYNGRLGVLTGEYTEREIKFVIGQCDFFIGSRMHACIAALSQCVPAVSIAYSDKFIGIMEPLGLGVLTVDPRTTSCEEILQAVQSSYQKRQVLRAQLVGKMPEVEQSARQLFYHIEKGLNPCSASAGVIG